MAQRTIVVVGGALAGPTAAARAREVDEHARIVLLERAGSVSYAVAGLAYHLSGEVEDVAALDRERAAFFRDVYAVEVRTGVGVSRIDARGRAVELATGERLRWDALVVSTGVGSVVPPVLEGARNVTTFRNLADLRVVTTALSRGARRVVVIGGGPFGVEAADGLARRGLEPVLLEHGSQLLPAHSPHAARAAARGLTSAGVEVRLEATVAGVDRRGDRARALVLADGSRIDCDLVVVTAGVRPRTDLLAAAGARLHEGGAVHVDALCRTSLEGVWACGTCVALPHAVTGKPTWLPQAAIADKTAQVAGAGAAGGSASLGAVLGTAIVRAGSVVVARTGAPRSELQGAETTRVHPLSHDGFFPGARAVSIELSHDAGSDRVLAAEVWGEAGVERRIDVLATAIAGRLCVDDLAALDLAYAPPFGTARDAVNVAGTVAVSDAAARASCWTPEMLAASSHHVLVDIRPAAIRKAEGWPHGSILVSFGALRTKDSPLAALERTPVFVSTDGRAGAQAARIARARGVSDAGYLGGGIRSWLDAGLPLEGGGATPSPARAKRARVSVASKRTAPIEPGRAKARRARGGAP